MNDTDPLPRHMLDIRELTAEAFAPYGQVVAPLRTGGQDAETASVKLIITGEQYSTVFKDTRELAKATVELVDKVLSGGKPDGLDEKTKAVPLRFSLPLERVAPGRYECQVTVLEPTGQKVAFWRAPVVVVP